MVYTTILHPVRKAFGISCNDYCVADMIYNLSANPAAPILGWCNASRQTLADAMGLSRKSVIDIIGKLEEKGLVERQQATDYLRTTSLWYDSVTGCKERLQPVTKGDSKETLQGVKKGYSECEERLQEGVKKGDTIIKDYNKIYNKTTKSEKSSSSPVQQKQEPSDSTLEAEKDQVMPTPNSAAPLPDEDPAWVKEQRERQRETMKPIGIKTWEEASEAIKKAKDVDMLINRTLKANRTTGWTVDLVIARFIEQKAFATEKPTWKDEADLRRNFQAWLPKHFEDASNKSPLNQQTHAPSQQIQYNQFTGKR